jgi:hypothetical protein
LQKSSFFWVELEAIGCALNNFANYIAAVPTPLAAAYIKTDSFSLI